MQAEYHSDLVICHFFLLLLIRPYVGCLVQYLPLLWKQSEEHNMLRCAILTTLIHLVQVRRITNLSTVSASCYRRHICTSFNQGWAVA